MKLNGICARHERLANCQPFRYDDLWLSKLLPLIIQIPCHPEGIHSFTWKTQDQNGISTKLQTYFKTSTSRPNIFLRLFPFSLPQKRMKSLKEREPTKARGQTQGREAELSTASVEPLFSPLSPEKSWGPKRSHTVLSFASRQW